MPKAGESKTTKASERSEYYARKEKLIALEEKNYDKIMFARGMGGFWFVIGHSAVILANRVAPALKIRVPLKKDTDYRQKSKEGMVSVNNMSFYRTALRDSSLTTLKSETKNLVTFSLKEKLTPEIYDVVLHEQDIKRQQIANSIMKSVPMPKTHATLNNTLKLAFKLYAEQSDSFCRKVFADKMMDELRTAGKIFILVCREDLPFETGLNEVVKKMSYAAASLAQISELGLWSVEKCMSLAGLIVETQAELAAERKMIEKMVDTGKLKICMK